MAKKETKGRTPALAPYVDSPFKIYMMTGGKEYDAQVLSSGVIKIDEKEFTSPSSAGSYLLSKNAKGKPLQVDGWKSWNFNKDGKRVPLDTLRGSKSPLKAEDKPKKVAKPKAKKVRKPRTPKKAAEEKAAA